MAPATLLLRTSLVHTSHCEDAVKTPEKAQGDITHKSEAWQKKTPCRERFKQLTEKKPKGALTIECKCLCRKKTHCSKVLLNGGGGKRQWVGMQF